MQQEQQPKNIQIHFQTSFRSQNTPNGKPTKKAIKAVAKLLNIKKENGRQDKKSLYLRLLQAAEDGKYKKVKKILQEYKGLPQSEEEQLGENFSLNLFLRAAKSGHLDVLKLLVKENPQLIYRLDQKGKSAVHHASSQGHQDIISYLLQKGNNVNIQDKEHKTPLHNAVRWRNMKACEVLINKGAKVDIKDVYGVTPIFDASRYGYLEIIDLLVKSGADINMKDNYNITPLKVAADCGEAESLKVLLNYGAKYDLSEPFWQTLPENRSNIRSIMNQYVDTNLMSNTLNSSQADDEYDQYQYDEFDNLDTGHSSFYNRSTQQRQNVPSVLNSGTNNISTLEKIMSGDDKSHSQSMSQDIRQIQEYKQTLQKANSSAPGYKKDYYIKERSGSAGIVGKRQKKQEASEVKNGKQQQQTFEKDLDDKFDDLSDLDQDMNDLNKTDFSNIYIRKQSSNFKSESQNNPRINTKIQTVAITNTPFTNIENLAPIESASYDEQQNSAIQTSDVLTKQISGYIQNASSKKVATQSSSCQTQNPNDVQQHTSKITEADHESNHQQPPISHSKQEMEVSKQQSSKIGLENRKSANLNRADGNGIQYQSLSFGSEQVDSDNSQNTDRHSPNVRLENVASQRLWQTDPQGVVKSIQAAAMDISNVDESLELQSIKEEDNFSKMLRESQGGMDFDDQEFKSFIEPDQSYSMSVRSRFYDDDAQFKTSDQLDLGFMDNPNDTGVIQRRKGIETEYIQQQPDLEFELLKVDLSAHELLGSSLSFMDSQEVDMLNKNTASNDSKLQTNTMSSLPSPNLPAYHTNDCDVQKDTTSLWSQNYSHYISFYNQYKPSPTDENINSAKTSDSYLSHEKGLMSTDMAAKSDRILLSGEYLEMDKKRLDPGFLNRLQQGLHPNFTQSRSDKYTGSSRVNSTPTITQRQINLSSSGGNLRNSNTYQPQLNSQQKLWSNVQSLKSEPYTRIHSNSDSFHSTLSETLGDISANTSMYQGIQV